MRNVCPRCRRYYPCICTRTAKACAAAMTAALLLVACSGAAGPHGTVTGKEHDEARTTWRTEPKTKLECTTKIRRVGPSTSPYQDCRTVPDGVRSVADHHPECWELELDSGDEVCVSEDLWNDTAIGDEYPKR